ncbi:hypothetical protein ABMA27_009467 [Loxostege sticticalis]|uniref:Uncharacterized protein n=1 Tax=Loxostege sticticalis TaxID=481309 RepID=A0ABR3H809_LOXSC
MAVLRIRPTRRNKVIITSIVASCIIYFIIANNKANTGKPFVDNLDIHRRLIEKKLEEALKLDKGTGCKIPDLDPFNKEVTQFHKNVTAFSCSTIKDWVKCYNSECKVVKEVLDATKDIVCTYKDIIYETDQNHYLGSPVDVYGDEPYVLTRSDHVKVKCKATFQYSIFSSTWTGVSAGIREIVSALPPENKDSINVLILGYDSMSKNGFIRHMPKTYKYITEELKVTILHGYNNLGDGTTATLFPILTGRSELELPDARKKPNNNITLDVKDLIFHKLEQHGYRTAYFEDCPSIGTFQYRYNGFNSQPADHYLYPFFLEDKKIKFQEYCIGDTPTHNIMMNITDQLLNIPDTKKFIFTFMVGISHNDINMVSHADEATVEFFKSFKEKGRTKDTLLMFMGDHGTRYAEVRKTLQGRLEERLPLMAILLPENLLQTRPSAQKALESNARVLTTPFDIHATFLDAMDLRQYTPGYTIPGADMPRAMSLLKPISENRSCSEAGIEPHWCACVSWNNLLPDDPLYGRAAQALLDFINEILEPVRSYCVPRTLTFISWVMKKQPNREVMEFLETKDVNGFEGKFGSSIKSEKENYQVKMTVGPGTAVFEGTITYNTKSDQFSVDSRDISRTNRYNHEPDCIQHTHPHLNMYCFCKKQV